MTTSTSQQLTIFEGPDGSGKTTAAKAYAAQHGARYVHLGPFPQVEKGLPRLYTEAMLPAVLGYQAVVLDRCWLSEVPYGTAFRGRLRTGDADRRMLERLALRCGAVVVRCQPPWETVKANYLSRKHLEMLENEQQLRKVYQLYERLETDLPTFRYDYTRSEHVGSGTLSAQWTAHRTLCHPLGLSTAGNWEASTILVGDDFGEVKEQDPLYQWPFASFTGLGCSRWLTEHLMSINKSEHDLLWVNAKQLDVWFGAKGATVYALGEVAVERLAALDVACQKVPHPQFHKRFHSTEPYPLRFT